MVLKKGFFVGSGGGIDDFIGLVDTPSAYTGQAGKIPIVNDTEDGLEFVSICDLIMNCPEIQDIMDDIETIKDVLSEVNDIDFTATKKGLLYNYYAFSDAKNLANTGWKVPSSFSTLQSNLGISTYNTSDAAVLITEDLGGTNTVGFNGVFGGRRLYSTGIFEQEGTLNMWRGYIFWSIALTTNVENSCDVPQFKFGFSVRLVKESTTLSHGEKGTYIGNDGKVYPTIAIGDSNGNNVEEWLAANLAETKFRDGTPIPEITDNATWAATTTPALCAYNNDWSNV